MAIPDVSDVQWLFTEDDLNYTPTVTSQLMTASEERKARHRACHFIYRVADRLGLHSHILTTATTFLHRFFMRRLMRPVGSPASYQGQPTFAWQDVALAALYLATKVEESYRRLDDILNLGMQYEERIGDAIWSATTSTPEAAWRQAVLQAEERLLDTLCFDLVIDHPQKYLLLATKQLDVDVTITRIAMAHLHDACRDPLSTFYEAPVLAAGVFALACQDADIDTSELQERGGNVEGSQRKGWMEIFDVSEEEVIDVLKALTEQRSRFSQNQNQLATETAPPSTLTSPLPTPIRSPVQAFGTPSAASTMARAATPAMEALKDTARPPSRHGQPYVPVSPVMERKTTTEQQPVVVAEEPEPYVPLSPVF